METYYDPKDLAHFPDIGKDVPELWQKFLDWYNAVFAEGALSEREKALIALAVAQPLYHYQHAHQSLPGFLDPFGQP